MSGKPSELSAKETSILKTLVFFDMFDYPLTAFEIWQYSDRPAALGEVLACLDGPGALRGRVGSQDGFYFLNGRAPSVAVRRRRYHYSARKRKKALRFCRLFRLVPWVELVAVGNMIGADNLRRESDIDLFITVRPGRIWLARLACAGLVAILNARPKPGREQDKICLSFYLARGESLAGLMIDRDVYFKHWLSGLRPLMETGQAYRGLIRSNQWIRAELPNWRPAETVASRRLRGSSRGFYAEFFDLLFGPLEAAARRFQLRILPAELKNALNRDTRVVMNDRVLKLFSKDRRQAYRDRYESALQKAAPG